MSEDNFNAVYVLSSTPRPGTIDNGTAEYALTRNDDSDTVLCYMELPMGDADFWSRILRSQACKAWAEGFAEGKEYGSESTKWFSPEEPVNPYLPTS